LLFLSKWLIVLSTLLIAATALAAEEKAMDFRLHNWDGGAVSLEALRGRVVVLTFSYSYCSARCPIVTARLSALDAEMDAPGEVVYLHVSVDPEMDTPERRLEYFGLYRIDAEEDGRWMFVSGREDELLRVWKHYGIDVKRVEDERIPEGYYMQYPQKVVIIDKEGFIRDETDTLFDEEELAGKIMGLARR
jgi:protein SCO1/2